VKSSLIFPASPWWILLCVGLGTLFAYFFYESSPFDKKVKFFLFFARTILFSALAFLLLGPLLKLLISKIEKPEVLVLIDDSKSMNYGGDNVLKSTLNTLEVQLEKIKSEGYKVNIQTISSDSIKESLTELKFNSNKTNISDVFQRAKLNYEGKNLSDVILVSDGIVNDGFVNMNLGTQTQIHTLGLGDSTLKKDVKISGIIANKIAYFGNKFSISADIASYGYNNSKSSITIKDGNGQILQKQEFLINSEDFFKSFAFELPTKSIGLARYLIEIETLNGEFSKINNRKEVIIDVVDGRDKILILSSSTHPDVKAFRAILEKNNQLDIKIWLPSDPEPALDFDLLVLHGYPLNGQPAFLSNILKTKKPRIFIIDSATDLNLFNLSQNVINLNAGVAKFDKASLIINKNFNRFKLAENLEALSFKMPPLKVPFGEYSSKPGTELILYQGIFGVATKKPLLAINLSQDVNTAVLAGEGIWQWRLEEYAQTEKQESIDNLFLKTIELLSVKSDKSKLRAYPTLDKFTEDSPAKLAFETYNDLYEPIYGQNISLKIEGPNQFRKDFQFRNEKENNTLEIYKLKPGIYNYTAQTKIQNKEEISKGQFAVTQEDIELSNLTANFDFLKTLALENNGSYFTPNTISNLMTKLALNNKKKIISETEEIKDLVWFPLIFILLCLIATFEWVTRKYFGRY
jgi:hypothetical protein